MHLQAGALGNKEWPKPKPVQLNIVEWARSICQSVPLMFPLNFFSIKMQMWWCGSKTRVLVLWRFEPNLPQPVKNRVRGSPAGFGAHQVWHRCSVSFPLPRIIIAFLPSCSVSFSSSFLVFFSSGFSCFPSFYFFLVFVFIKCDTPTTELQFALNFLSSLFCFFWKHPSLSLESRWLFCSKPFLLQILKVLQKYRVIFFTGIPLKSSKYRKVNLG